MKWRGRRGSANIEDRRGRRRGVAKAGGGLGLGAVVLFLAGILFPEAVPVLKLFGVGAGGGTQTTVTREIDPSDEQAQFVSVVLADTEEIWADIFRTELNAKYPEPNLVLFEEQTSSPCGLASSASGPFYCPGDSKLYLDLSFFRTLDRQLGAPGDFARAYVVAHEVAHHVQNVTGIIPEVDAYRRRSTKTEANRATVRLELQADCYSGIWARRAATQFGSLDRGDIEEALQAAAAIGDDRLQKQSRGYVVPDSFTHGTSEQRVRWFATGFDANQMAACDTFSQSYNQL